METAGELKRLQGEAALGRRYLAALRQEVIRLALLADDALEGAVLEKVTEKLGEDASGLCAKLQMGMRAMLLSAHPALSSAYANDVDPLMCYAQQLFVMGRKQDVVIGLSTSGNAENIQNVFKVAGGLGIRRILFTGNRHGKCERYADCVIAVPESETYRIQELHLPVYHAVCIMLEEYFYGK